MRWKGVGIGLVILLLLSSILILDINMHFCLQAEASTIYVDDDVVVENITHKKTIQAAVDNASEGDTVFVYNGNYRENVVVNKTLNIIGENRFDTKVDGMGDICFYVNDTDYVNISHISILNGSIGINIRLSLNCNFSSNLIDPRDGIHDDYDFIDGGIGIYSESSTLSIYGNNIHGGHGGYVTGGGMTLMATGGTGGDGLYIINSSISMIQNIIYGGDGGEAGPAFEWSWGGDGGNGLYAKNSTIYMDGGLRGGSGSNGDHFGGDGGSGIYHEDSDSLIFDSHVVGGAYGFGPMWDGKFGYGVSCIDSISHVINSTLHGTIFKDFYEFYNDYALHLVGESNSTLLNSDFNESKIYFKDKSPTLTVLWYLDVNTINVLSQSVQYATVCIKDSRNSLPIQQFKTDSQGFIRWLVETEYKAQDLNGDTIGERIYYTPHKITAWNETILGFTEVIINESKSISVLLDTPSYEIPLYKGWNLISLPLVQPDTSIPNVLSSIAGNYNKVEWYNTSEDQWHTTYDDLTDLDHTMGFWIHMKTDDTLTVTGTIPNTTSIQLYNGWNMVGNPKFCNWDIAEILSSIAGNYTAIQWYDASDKSDPWKHFHVDKPPELNDLKYMTFGRGYWIKVEQDCVWDVSNF